jgi:ABC-type multidrug transport system ATPase subunit
MGLVGANGAGKSTLLDILATVQLPTSGTGTVGGYDLIDQSAEIRRTIAYCAAGSEGFFPQLTARANLEFFAALHGLSPIVARTRTRFWLDAIGASSIADVAVQRCSAGMRQRLNLARALLADTPILLLDEPTRSLDAHARRDFQRLLRHALVSELNKTVLLVTHDAMEADAVCDRVAVLSDGTITSIRAVNSVIGDDVMPHPHVLVGQ